MKFICPRKCKYEVTTTKDEFNLECPFCKNKLIEDKSSIQKINNQIFENLDSRYGFFWKYDSEYRDNIHHSNLNSSPSGIGSILALIRALWQIAYAICHGLDLILNELKKSNERNIDERNNIQISIPPKSE